MKGLQAVGSHFDYQVSLGLTLLHLGEEVHKPIDYSQKQLCHQHMLSLIGASGQGGSQWEGQVCQVLPQYVGLSKMLRTQRILEMKQLCGVALHAENEAYSSPSFRGLEMSQYRI